jgi:DUF2914 family protein
VSGTWNRAEPTGVGKVMLIRQTILALLFTTATSYADDPKPQPPAAKTDEKPSADKPSAEIKAGTGVENHEIVGEATEFTAGSTVFVWSRITNGEGSVKHVWKHDGKEVWTATLPVGSKRWSTQTRRTIGSAGSWEVDVQTPDGTSLGTIAFTIK